MNRPCEAEGCDHVVQAPKRFCDAPNGGHWAMIPDDLRLKMFDALEGPDRDAIVTEAAERLKAADERRRARRK